MPEKRHIKNIPAITADEQTLLGQKTVAIVGCGGLGGYLAEFMGRLGVGSLRLVDGDCFEESNLNRQLYAEMPLLGQNKTASAARRLQRIHPEIRVQAHDVFLTAENAAALLAGCDVVLDGLDSVSARRVLSDACDELGIPCVWGGVNGWTAQAALGLPGDGLVHRLYPEAAPTPDETVLSFTPALCAAVQSALCTRYLCGRAVESGMLYYFDLLEGDFETFSLKGD